MRWQTIAAGVLFVVLAAVAVVGFTRDPGPEELAASPAATVPPDPSPIPEPSPSTSPTEDLVLPANDVDDPLEAIVAIEAYRDWLFENPDPELVRFIYHPECGCTEPLEEALAALQADAKSLRGLTRTGVTDVRLVREDTDRVVVVEYTIHTPALELLGPDGDVLSTREPAAPARVRTSLFRGEGGRWIVTFIEELE